MQRYSICLGLAQINMWKDVQLGCKTLGKIHHRSETHMSLSKAIYALDLILSHLLKNITPAILFFLLHYQSSPLHWITPISVQTRQYLFLQPQRIKHSIKLKRKTTSPATNTFLCFIFTVRPLESIYTSLPTSLLQFSLNTLISGFHLHLFIQNCSCESDQ